MAQPAQEPPPCPFDMGSSVAFRAMDDTATFYLAHGGVSVAREKVETVAGVLKFYDDFPAAFEAVMKRLDAEAALEEQQRQQTLLASLTNVVRDAQQPPKPPEPPEPVPLPPELATEEAMVLWRRLQQAGYFDEYYRPRNLTRKQLVIIADQMARRLKLKHKWQPFQQLWKIDYMKQDYQNAIDQLQTSHFLDDVKHILNGQ